MVETIPIIQLTRKVKSGILFGNFIVLAGVKMIVVVLKWFAIKMPVHYTD